MSDSAGGPWAPDPVPPTIQQPGVTPPPTPAAGQPPTGGPGGPGGAGGPGGPGGPSGPGEPPVYPPAGGTPPPTPWYKQPWPYAVAAAVILLGSAIAFFALRDSGDDGGTTPPTSLAPTSEPTTTEAATTTTAAATTTEAATTTTLAPTTTEATTTTAATTTAPPPTTTTLPPFTDGTRPVGTGAGQVQPGRYVAPTGTGSTCTWQRLSAQSGPNNVLGEGEVDGAGQAVVDIVATDKFFTSTGCGTWTGFVAPEQQLTSIGSGQYVVGAAGTGEIAADAWRTQGGADCTWFRLKAFTGDPDDVIAQGTADSPATVQLAATDAGFSSSGCGGWVQA